MNLKQLKYLAFVLVLISTACSKTIEYEYPQDPQNQRQGRAGKFFSDDIVIYGKKKMPSVKKPIVKDDKNDGKITSGAEALFFSSKQLISEISEVDVADPELGVVASKWQENPTTHEKTKITILVHGDKIVEDSLNIAVHKEYLDQNGVWQNKKDENEALLIKLLKEKIISRIKIITPNK